MGPVLDRPRIPVDGAAEVLAAFAAHRATLPDGLAAARALRDVPVAWADLGDALVTSPRSIIVAGEQGGGPLLGVKRWAPGAATTIHAHAVAGAGLVVQGRIRYERFERAGEATATLESVHDLAEGDTCSWGAPPDDLHRQRSLGEVCVELVLVAGPPSEDDTFTDVTPAPRALRAAWVDGLLRGDRSVIEPFVHPDVLLDANVPTWRFQQRGRDGVLGLLEDEELTRPDRRVSHLRATDTAEGLLLETELRFTERGELRLLREVHNLRVRDGLVVEHVLWCSGISGPAQIEAQRTQAPMERW